MKKLNRKGYMTVEIIIASVLAFAIAFFLMQITMKLVDVNDNEYVKTEFMTDKALVMKNIKNNIRNDINKCGKITSIELSEEYNLSIGKGGQWYIYFDNGDVALFGVAESDGKLLVRYVNTEQETYSKSFTSEVSSVNVINGINDPYVYFQIGCKNIFSDDDYNINIVVYNG